MDILLQDLSPHTQYTVQIRSTAEDGTVSQWSPSFSFITDKDMLAPAPVSNLIVDAVGTSFVAKWNAPTTNANGDPLTDLAHYIVEVESESRIARYKTVDLKFDFTIEMNSSVFLGPESMVKMRVFAVDYTGNMSVSSGDVTAQNAPPADIPAPTVTAQADGIMVRWETSTADDLKTHNVYIATGASAPAAGTLGTLIAQEPGGSFFYPTLTYDVVHYFSVRAVDLLGTTSTGAAWSAGVQPTNYNLVDLDPPPAPTGFSANGIPNGLEIVWTEPTVSDAVGYRIRYKKQSSSDWEFVDTSLASPKQGKTFIRGLEDGVTYDVGIKPYDQFFNFPVDWLSTTGIPTVDTTVLPSPTGFAGYAKPTQVSAVWNDVEGAKDYEVQLATDAAFTLPVATYPKFVTAPFFVSETLTTGTAYHIRVRARNGSGTSGLWVTQTVTTPATGTIPFGDPYLSGSAIIEDTLAGNRVIANTLDAGVLKADTAINQQLTVANKLTMGTVGTTSGEIVSGNYVSGSTGYRLTHNSLDIQTGLINAGVISVGTLQSSQTVDIGGGVLQPQWSLNLAGNMQINSATVRGSMVIGSTANPTSGTLQSHQYVAGSAGWQVRADGTSEFSNSTFRGTIYATNSEFTGRVTSSSGQIANWTISPGSLQGNPGLTSEVGLSTSGWAFWAGGASGTAPFRVSTGGYLYASSAEIVGTIRASAGNIGNWTIDSLGIYGSGRINGGSISGTTITGSTFKTADSGMRIEMSTSFLNEIYFYDVNNNYSRIAAITGGVKFYGGGTSAITMTNALTQLYNEYVVNLMGPTIRMQNPANGYVANLDVIGSNAVNLGGWPILTQGNMGSYVTGTSHQHTTIDGWQIMTANNKQYYTFPPEGHTHSYAAPTHSHGTADLTGTINSAQPTWTGGGANNYDTGTGRGTSVTDHVHTSTSHYHTVSL